MPIAMNCACGHHWLAPDRFAGTRVACPSCHRDLDVPLVAKAKSVEPASSDSAAEDEFRLEPIPEPSRPSEAPPPEQRGPASSKIAPLAHMARALLDPRSIHLMLSLGGSLSVLGLIVWLTSLGVFENKVVLAAALGAGTLSLLGGGWWLVLKTKFRLAGQALTFLACVVMPLNLWFYHAQGLVTLSNGLWVGGVACCLLYAATVYALRNALFMYSFEAGLTLTVLLFLGQLHLIENMSYVCLALTGLGFLSVHAHQAFAEGKKGFTRERFGMPLFWSGHVQLGAALGILLLTQLAGWLIGPIETLAFFPGWKFPWREFSPWATDCCRNPISWRRAFGWPARICICTRTSSCGRRACSLIWPPAAYC